MPYEEALRFVTIHHFPHAILDLVIVDPPGSPFSVGPWEPFVDGTLQPVELEVRFQPSAPGDYQATLLARLGMHMLEIPLSGTAE